MLISIVIPTHNRPDFLLEAIRSVKEQTYDNFEVVVVDDGSTPEISVTLLEKELNRKIVFLRHDLAKGVPKAKNAGINIARGEVILLLDDDDLLMPHTLENINKIFSDSPEIDCLFLGVQPFGKYANGPSLNRKTSLKKIFDIVDYEEHEEIYLFPGKLFEALLETVPIDFQRPAARRAMWNIVGPFDEESLYSESSWSIRASCLGTIALTKKKLTQWRIHDNNFGWPADMKLEKIRLRQMNNTITSGVQLLKMFRNKKSESNYHVKQIKRHLSKQFFTKSYYLQGKNFKAGIVALFRSFLLSPNFSHLKLAIKYIFPKFKKNLNDL
ncbi:glycosyltransferase family 2 protein [Desulfobacter postgatei]|jgi:glycosyltransferase involved in cell wall biosynthesis|uniref:glycosyltransferase family 2 protein n=1 Tax=Desulfobacter postgatei TaxID=2293 RepID=UPI002A3630CA|nr:glycosyltransferase family 2 protein [Desulfobacter postgatei]MDX9964215.1 glycosyltransferase family 2 protein [Desulfobacter postgatei]